MDINQYFVYYCCNPKHTKNKIPFNLDTRPCTTISDKNLLNSRLSELRYLLQQRNYPKSLVEQLTTPRAMIEMSYYR